MTDHILSLAKEWQNRSLERKYAIVFMDAVFPKAEVQRGLVKNVHSVTALYL